MLKQSPNRGAEYKDGANSPMTMEGHRELGWQRGEGSQDTETSLYTDRV